MHYLRGSSAAEGTPFACS